MVFSHFSSAFHFTAIHFGLHFRHRELAWISWREHSLYHLLEYMPFPQVDVRGLCLYALVASARGSVIEISTSPFPAAEAHGTSHDQ